MPPEQATTLFRACTITYQRLTIDDNQSLIDFSQSNKPRNQQANRHQQHQQTPTNTMSTTSNNNNNNNNMAVDTVTNNDDNHNKTNDIDTNNDTDANNDDNNVNVNDEKKSRAGLYQKLAIGLVLLAFIVYIIVDSVTAGNVRNAIEAFLDWIEDNPIPGFFAFMVVYFVATVLFVPGSILTLGSGFVFANAFGLGPGVLLGSLSVFIGASGGAIVAFLLGRYLLRDWVKGLTKKYAVFEALDVALQEKGFRIMSLLRLSPIIPFNAINYIGGVTAISLTSYALALVAILPGTVLYVFLGASAGSLADSASSGDNTTVTIIVVVVGAIFGICAIAVTSYYAKKELNRVIAAREEAEKVGSTDDEAPESADIEQGVGTDDADVSAANREDEPRA